MYDKGDFFRALRSVVPLNLQPWLFALFNGHSGTYRHRNLNDLVTRAADVMLKERRKLILVLRDTLVWFTSTTWKL